MQMVMKTDNAIVKVE